MVKIYTDNFDVNLWCPKAHPLRLATLGKDETFLCLNTTVKSAWHDIGIAFAPTWNMVMGVKKGKITWEEYTKEYTDLMRHRYKENPSLFKEALQYDNLVLRCYCKKKQCHRYLLTNILLKVAKAHGIKAEYKGEILKKDYLLYL